jgi:hypothetical protein
VQNFLYMTDGGYTDEEILKAERYILGIMTRRCRHEAVVDDRDLHQVLGHGARVDVVAVRFRPRAQGARKRSLGEFRFLSSAPRTLVVVLQRSDDEIRVL